MRLGTNNGDFRVILKNLVKQLAFFFSISKFRQRKKLQNVISVEEKYQICNEILCIHQSKFEILELARKIMEKDPKVICEIGTADGGTSLFLGSSCQNLETIICIDLFIKNKRKLSFFLRNKVKFIDASSYHF